MCLLSRSSWVPSALLCWWLLAGPCRREGQVSVSQLSLQSRAPTFKNKNFRPHWIFVAVCSLLLLQCMGSVATWHVGSSFPNQGSNPFLCTGRQTLNHWTTRESFFLSSSLPSSFLSGNKKLLQKQSSNPFLI